MVDYVFLSAFECALASALESSSLGESALWARLFD